MISINFSKIFGFLFVLVSLQTHYFYQINSPAISLLGLLLIGFLVVIHFFYNDIKISTRSFSVFLFLSILFSYSALSFLFMDISTSYTRILGFIIVIFASLIGAASLNLFNLKTLLKTFLTINIFCFYLQLFVYYIFGYHIDFIEPITGETQRVLGGTFQLFFGSFIRPSGLFSEPGTYALFVAPMVCLYTRYAVNNNYENRLWYLCIFSLFLSFSLYGIVFAIMIAVLRLSSRITINQILMMVVMVFIVSGYIQYRILFNDDGFLPDGAGFRFEFIEKTFQYSSASVANLLLGTNLFSKLPGFIFYYSVNDVGLVFYLFHFSGLLGFAIILGFFGYWMISVDKFSNMALLIILLSKFSIFYPFFPLLILISLKNEEFKP